MLLVACHHDVGIVVYGYFTVEQRHMAGRSDATEKEKTGKHETELDGYGASSEVVKAVIDVLDKCEFAQYAPELSGSDMNHVLEQASDVMDKLENTKKRK